MRTPWTVLGWSLVVLVWIVILIVTVRAGLVVTRPMVTFVKRYWDNRYRRKFRRGKWIAKCDVCHEPAHYMIISANIPWGTGGKRCWKHRLVEPPLIASKYQRVMPVNRETAWRDDKPPPAERMVFIQTDEAIAAKEYGP
jgi:hypothetical protein